MKLTKLMKGSALGALAAAMAITAGVGSLFGVTV